MSRSTLHLAGSHEGAESDLAQSTLHAVGPASRPHPTGATNNRQPAASVEPQSARRLGPSRRGRTRAQLRTIAARADTAQPLSEGEIAQVVRVLTRGRARKRDRTLAAEVVSRAALSDDQREAIARHLSEGLDRRLKRPVAKAAGRWLWRVTLMSLLSPLLMQTGCTYRFWQWIGDPVWATRYGKLFFFSGGWFDTSGTVLGYLWDLVFGSSTNGPHGAMGDLAVICIWVTVSILYAWPIAAALSALAAPITGRLDRRRQRTLWPLISALGDLHDPQAISPLALAFTRKPLLPAAASALSTALSALSEDHYGRLDRATVPRLCDAVKRAQDTDALAILGALAKIGDERAIPAVTACLKRKGDVAEEAQRVLPILESRKAEERSPAMLLRPAVAPGGPDVLLRAAAHAETSAHELLRIVEHPAAS